MAARTLHEVGSSHENNLELIRYVATCLVICSHSFPLTMEAGVSDSLSTITQGQTSFGDLAVAFWVYADKVPMHAGAAAGAMFLWALPVQQVLVALSHGQIAWYANAGLGIVISLLLGVVAYACVERGIMGNLHKGATRRS